MMASDPYDPSTLPPITAVEIVVLGFNPDGVDEYMRRAKNDPGVRLVGDSAQKIAKLWRTLPPGEPMRCHVPTYGLRFFFESKLVVQASVCWKCNNLYGDLNDTVFSYAFDGTADVSQQLLASVKAVAGLISDGE